MNIRRAVLAGFVATVVLSVLMLLKGMMGVMPELNVITMLADMMYTGPVFGWVAHFLIGSVVWGIAFAVLFRQLPGNAPWQKGAMFGVAAWLMMMLAIMPMAGAGLFGLKLGMMAPIMTLILHIIFGTVLGSVYGRPVSASVGRKETSCACMKNV